MIYPNALSTFTSDNIIWLYRNNKEYSLTLDFYFLPLFTCNYGWFFSNLSIESNWFHFSSRYEFALMFITSRGPLYLVATVSNSKWSQVSTDPRKTLLHNKGCSSWWLQNVVLVKLDSYIFKIIIWTCLKSWRG